MNFLCKVIAGLPDDISSQIHVHHVGNSAANSGLPAISEMVKLHGLDNWTIHGSSVSDEYLMTLRLKWGEALLFPSASEGFGYHQLNQWRLECQLYVQIYPLTMN